MEPPLVQSPSLSSHGAPFADIINQQMGRIYQEVEKESVKQRRKVVEMPVGLDIVPNNDSPSQKINNDTTIKKEGKLTLQSLSAKTIKDGVEDQRMNEENNFDFDLLPGSGQIELFKLLDCLQPFQEIKRVFYEEGKRYKLSMCQNTENFATIKRNNFGSCKCIIKMWSSGNSQATVYQLRSSGNKQKKAKIILVEGEEQEFRKFTLSVMRNLGERNYVKLTNSEKVEIFCVSNGQIFEGYRKECSKLLAKGPKLSQNNKPQIDCILLKIKQSCEELKELIRSAKEIQFSSAVSTQIEEIFFSQTLIRQLYDQLYLSQSENYRKRREGLLKRYNLFDIFRHLEISEHYSQFRKRRDSLRGSSKSIENVPYMPAIRCLQQMLHATAPSALLEKLMLFHEKIKNSYNEYFLSQMRLGEIEMDEELPVTIFCVLAMEGESSIWGSVKMLETYLKQSGGEWQGKAVTGVQAALEFIGSWDQ